MLLALQEIILRGYSKFLLSS